MHLPYLQVMISHESELQRPVTGSAGRISKQMDLPESTGNV